MSKRSVTIFPSWVYLGQWELLLYLTRDACARIRAQYGISWIFFLASIFRSSLLSWNLSFHMVLLVSHLFPRYRQLQSTVFSILIGSSLISTQLWLVVWSPSNDITSNTSHLHISKILFQERQRSQTTGLSSGRRRRTSGICEAHDGKRGKTESK